MLAECTLVMLKLCMHGSYKNTVYVVTNINWSLQEFVAKRPPIGLQQTVNLVCQHHVDVRKQCQHWQLGIYETHSNLSSSFHHGLHKHARCLGWCYLRYPTPVAFSLSSLAPKVGSQWTCTWAGYGRMWIMDLPALDELLTNSIASTWHQYGCELK